MSSFFNPKRFFLLERYKMQETGKQLLWTAVIVLSICILSLLYDINRGESFFTYHTSGGNLYHYTLWFLLIAPCLLEAHLGKRNSVLYALLPASSFEKFLHIWIKYLVLLPLFCILLITGMKGIFSSFDIAYLQHFARDIVPHPIRKDQILTISILQSVFFTGYFYFRRQIILKSFTTGILIIGICLGMITCIMYFLPDDWQGYWFNSIATWPETNVPLSPAGRIIIDICNYAAPACLMLGSWISSYFLLKEKQI